MKSNNAGFVLGAAALAALIAIGAYFFLFNPALTARTDAIGRLEEAESFNETLELQLATKKAEAERLPEYEEQLEEIQEQLLPREDVAQIRRDLGELVAASNAILTSDTVTTAELVTPGAVDLTTAAAAVGRQSTVSSLAFQNLYATKFTITATGTYADLTRLAARLQMNEGRYFLLDSWQIQTVGGAAPDSPANVDFTVVAYTLFDGTSGIDPGSNSGSVDPDTGEPLPPLPPGDGLTPVITVPLP